MSDTPLTLVDQLTGRTLVVDDSWLCRICGCRFSSASYGGPGICPSCDCGIQPVAAQKARIESLEREVAALRADAERYRWLRMNLYAIDGEYGVPPQCAIVFKWHCNIPVGKGVSLDAAIDSARGGA